MKTKMNPTSLVAYWALRDSGELPEKERIVFDTLYLNGAMTREQIAERTGMKEGSACGRVNKLMERGLVVVAGMVINKLTGKPNEVVALVEHRKPQKKSCFSNFQMQMELA